METRLQPWTGPAVDVPKREWQKRQPDHQKACAPPSPANAHLLPHHASAGHHAIGVHAFDTAFCLMPPCQNPVTIVQLPF